MRYAPSSAGSDSSTLTVDEGAAGNDTFSLSGTGVANRFIFTTPPGSSAFPDTAIGDTSGSKQITITNNTDYPGNPNVHLGGSDPGEFNESDTCGSNVANECTANVTFQPTSQGGKSATLQIDGDSFQFTGTGIGQFDVSPLSLSFGTQRVNTASAAQPITFTNHRNNAVNVSVSNGNPADYNVDASDCAGSVAAGASCSVAVVFQPNATGPQSGTVTVQGQDVSVAGTGTLPGASVSPGSIGFGNQPVSTSSNIRTITVTNTGTENLVISQPTLAGTNPAQFTISDTCVGASPLQPGDQCMISVQFFPTSVGPATAVVHVNDNAPGSPQTVNLSGTGTPSAVVFVPGPARFKHPHHAGTFSTPKTITLTNRTNGPLTIGRVHLGGSNPNSFRITGGNCAGRTIGSDASCTETVRFAPNEVGVKAASLIVNDNSSTGPHSVALTGTSTYPKDDAAVHGAVGCDATRITWKRGGSSSRFDRTVIVRSRTHIPTGPNDGTRLPHGRRRPARSRAPALLGLRLPGVRALSLAHPAGDPEPLTWSRPAPADGSDLHAHGRSRDQRQDADGLVASALHALRLLLPALPRRRPGGAEAIRARPVVHVPEPPAPASRLHVHALPVRVSALAARGHVDRAHHLPGALRRPVAQGGRGEEDDLRRGRIDHVRAVDALAAKSEVGHREREREGDQAEPPGRLQHA